MKLSEVTMRDKVPTGAVGDYTVRLRSMDGPGPSLGWSLEYNATTGCVYAEKGEIKMVIFPANLVFACPLPEPKKKTEKAA